MRRALSDRLQSARSAELLHVCVNSFVVHLQNFVMCWPLTHAVICTLTSLTDGRSPGAYPSSIEQK